MGVRAIFFIFILCCRGYCRWCLFLHPCRHGWWKGWRLSFHCHLETRRPSCPAFESLRLRFGKPLVLRNPVILRYGSLVGCSSMQRWHEFDRVCFSSRDERPLLFWSVSLTLTLSTSKVCTLSAVCSYTCEVVSCRRIVPSVPRHTEVNTGSIQSHR